MICEGGLGVVQCYDGTCFSVISLRRNHFFLLAALYALGMIYASLVIGPVGFHYVPIDFSEAVSRFAAIRFVHHESSERADWIGNLMLAVPFAFLLNSAFNSAATMAGRVIGIASTLAIAILLILAIKFAQLYFPPRTVTLNYIAAQVLGAVMGIVLFQLSHTRLYPRLAAQFENGDGLTIMLGAYTVWLIAYFLMPFDIVFSLGDLAARALQLTTILGASPGEGRSGTYQFLVIVADTLATVPVGMFLAVRGRQRRTRSLIFRALGLMVLIFIAQLFVLGAKPFLVALVYRTLGAIIGVLFIQRIKGKDLRKRHYYFSQYLPFAIPVYLLLVMFVSGLLTTEWATLDEALNALEPRQFLPFWNFYIVTKARASESFVVEFLMFTPIGVMVWLRRGFWSSGAKFSAILAFILSLLMEIGRMMKPGLRPDFSDPIIAALGAAAAFKSMPYLWKMFEREAARSGSLDSYIAQMQRGDPTAPAE
jgi:glycopeptide antibiotics resistance protein